MKIKDIRTRVFRWRGKTVPLASSFLHESDGPVAVAAGLHGHVHFPRLARGRNFHR